MKYPKNDVMRMNLQQFGEDDESSESDDGLTSLLDGLDDETLDELENTETDKKKSVSKPTDNNKEVASLTESNKNLQEQVRQLSEKNKETSEFIDRIKGVPDDDKTKEEQVKILRQFEEDPIGTVNMLVAQKLVDVDMKIDKSDANATVDRAMREIDKEYIIDWEKDYHKIIPILDDFDKKARLKDPKGFLIKAAKFANVIKRRDKSAPPYIEGEGSGTGGQRKVTSEGDKIKQGILDAGKKSDNVFGI